MRDPPLCQLWQLEETGPHTYSINKLEDFHEAMSDLSEFGKRQRAADEERAARDAKVNP
jgi:aspartate aminotransferase-like enzyme